MSLISDALRKARLESGDQPEPLPHRRAPAASGSRRPVWPWLVASISLSLAAGIVVGVLLLPVGGPQAPPAEPSTALRAEPAPELDPEILPVETAPPPVTRKPGTAETDPPTPRDPAAPTSAATSAPEGSGPAVGAEVTQDAEAASGSASPAEPEPGPEPETRASVVGSAPAAGSPSAASPDSRRDRERAGAREADESFAGPAAGSTHHRRVVLPDGRELALGGIAISDGTTAVLINGRVLAPGDSRDGWRLVRAETGRVEIEWEGIRFFLEL